ncbi:MAG: hypothetical protein RLZZ408_1342 [Verrucomicrobiota bacterium]|jgi:hypothetical protein
MNITNISSNALKNLIKLTQRKEGLLNEIQKIESQLASLITGKPARTTGKRRGRPAKAKKAGRPAKAAKATKGRSSAKRAPRGQIKKKILSALKAAGDAGMKVTDLSKKIGVKNANVHVWFSSTGKKLPEIKRVGKGHFKLVEKKA